VLVVVEEDEKEEEEDLQTAHYKTKSD